MSSCYNKDRSSAGKCTLFMCALRMSLSVCACMVGLLKGKCVIPGAYKGEGPKNRACHLEGLPILFSDVSYVADLLMT